MTTTISVPARKLRLMLSAVLPYAGEDDTLPALNAVSFEFRDGALYLAATNRYAIAVTREVVAGSALAGIPDQSAVLPADAARDLRRMLKKRDGTAALLIEDAKLTVDAGAAMGRWATVENGTFPAWRGLLRDALGGTQEPFGDNAGMRSGMLARLAQGPFASFDEVSIRLAKSAKAAEKGEPPMLLATVGDWFIAALMPVRVSEGVATQWAAWASVTAPAGKAEDAATEPGAESPVSDPAEVAESVAS